MSVPETKSRFETVVPTVAKFPMPIMVVGTLLLLINLFFLGNFLFNLQGIFPGLGNSGVVQQLQYMLAARQLGMAVVFGLALFGKNVRFMQLAWFLAFIREVGDLAGGLALGNNPGLFFIIPLIVIEIAAFIYTGAIASGHVAKGKSENETY